MERVFIKRMWRERCLPGSKHMRITARVISVKKIFWCVWMKQACFTLPRSVVSKWIPGAAGRKRLIIPIGVSLILTPIKRIRSNRWSRQQMSPGRCLMESELQHTAKLPGLPGSTCISHWVLHIHMRSQWNLHGL